MPSIYFLISYFSFTFSSNFAFIFGDQFIFMKSLIGKLPDNYINRLCQNVLQDESKGN